MDKGTKCAACWQVIKMEKGKAIYRKRKRTVESVFGIIKELMGFKIFSLRGEKKLKQNGYWLVSYIIKKGSSS